MYLLTQREVIQSVARRWSEQYGIDKWPDKQGTLKDLQALDLDECPQESVDDAIGNSSWTQLKCDECNTSVKSVVVFGDDSDYDRANASVCVKCLRKAAKLFREAV